MKKFLYILPLFFFSLIVLSCGEKEESTDSVESKGKIIVYAVNYSL